MHVSESRGGILIFLSVTFINAVHAGGYHDAYLLQKHLYTNYSTTIRPLLDQSDKLEVSVAFYLLTISNVDERLNKIIYNGFLVVEWKDELLSWDPSDFNGVDIIHPNPKDIWRPRMSLLNTMDERDIFEDKQTDISVDYQGNVVWSPFSLFPVTCLLDLRRFPADSHSCPLLFPIMHYNASYVTLRLSTGRPNLSAYIRNAGWQMENYAHYAREMINAKGHRVSTYQVLFSIKRLPVYFFINIMFPVVMLSFLTLLAFAIPAESGEKIGFSVTVLLAYTIYMSILSTMLPTTSDNMPYVIYFVFLLFLLAGLVCSDVIVIVWLHNREEIEEKRQKRGSKLSKAMLKINALKAFTLSKVRRFTSTALVKTQRQGIDQDHPLPQYPEINKDNVAPKDPEINKDNIISPRSTEITKDNLSPKQQGTNKDSPSSSPSSSSAPKAPKGPLFLSVAKGVGTSPRSSNRVSPILGGREGRQAAAGGEGGGHDTAAPRADELYYYDNQAGPLEAQSKANNIVDGDGGEDELFVDSAIIGSEGINDDNHHGVSFLSRSNLREHTATSLWTKIGERERKDTPCDGALQGGGGGGGGGFVNAKNGRKGNRYKNLSAKLNTISSVFFSIATVISIIVFNYLIVNFWSDVDI